MKSKYQFFVGRDNKERFALFLQSRITLWGRGTSEEVEMSKPYKKVLSEVFDAPDGYLPDIAQYDYAIMVERLFKEI